MTGCLCLSRIAQGSITQSSFGTAHAVSTAGVSIALLAWQALNVAYF